MLKMRTKNVTTMNTNVELLPSTTFFPDDPFFSGDLDTTVAVARWRWGSARVRAAGGSSCPTSQHRGSATTKDVGGVVGAHGRDGAKACAVGDSSRPTTQHCGGQGQCLGHGTATTTWVGGRARKREG